MVVQGGGFSFGVVPEGAVFAKIVFVCRGNLHELEASILGDVIQRGLPPYGGAIFPIKNKEVPPWGLKVASEDIDLRKRPPGNNILPFLRSSDNNLGRVSSLRRYLLDDASLAT